MSIDITSEAQYKSYLEKQNQIKTVKVLAYISPRNYEDILNGEDFGGQMYAEPSRSFNKQITVEVKIENHWYNNKSTNNE